MTTEYTTTTEGAVSSTFQNLPCYRYVRKSDRLLRQIDYSPDADEITVRVKLFNPTGAGTWWIAAFDPETGLAFGVVDLFCREAGSFDLFEIVEFRGVFGLPIERDLHFAPMTLAAALEDE